MDTRTRVINEALDLLSFELRPHINKIFMAKSMLLEGCGDILGGDYDDFDRFISGLYNVMDEATDAYTDVYEKIKQLRNDQPATAN